jgi:hypothetical protein
MRLTCLLLLGIMLLPAPGRADGRLPARNQALLLLRVLAYDRRVAAAPGEALTVAVVSPDDDPEARAEQVAIVRELEDAARGFLVSGRRVRVVAVPWRDAEALEATLRQERAAALYVVAALAAKVPAISAATRAASVLTFAGARGLVDDGLAVGLVVRAERAGVLVNLPAARAEGASLDSSLLSVAEVVKR